MSDQLIKKNGQGYGKVYPKTYIEGISDKISGKSLEDILKSYNHYFLVYTGNRKQTRIQLPKALRRKGVWITFTMFDGTNITEYFIGDDVRDFTFGDDNNWRSAYNYEITTEDLQLLHRQTEKLVLQLQTTPSDGTAVELTNSYTDLNINASASLETFGDEESAIINTKDYVSVITINGTQIESTINSNNVTATYILPKFIGQFKVEFTCMYNNVYGKKGVTKSTSSTIYQNARKYFGFSDSDVNDVTSLPASHFSNSVGCTVTILNQGNGYKHIYLAVPQPMTISRITQPDALNAPLAITKIGTVDRAIDGTTIVYNVYKSVDAIDSSVSKRLTIS